LIDPTWWWHDAQPLAFWDQLQQAVDEDRCIRVVYERRDGEAVERILKPYSLVAKSSVWYLVAEQGEELRTYRVSRFRQITLLDTHFQRRPEFDLPAYWREHLQDFVETQAEYKFTLRIHPDRLNFLKWIVPGRYQPVEPPDAGGWITVHLQLESVDLARMLVFGLGRQAVIVGPPELREAVLSAAREIVDKYGKG
jgi:predicted DNA-binding transcriptional regulator YafY